MSVVRRTVAGLLLAAALTGCTGDDETPSADPTPSASSLAELAEEQVSVVRGGFCPRVAPSAIEAALGAAAEDSATWQNGDRAEVADGTNDVVHEYGCSWTAADGTVATGWVFAPPVTAGRARRLATDAAQAAGCHPLPESSPFGAPTVAVACAADGRASTAYHGLFGDAWLSCSLESAVAPDPARADRWCAAVLQAASR